MGYLLVVFFLLGASLRLILTYEGTQNTSGDMVLSRPLYLILLWDSCIIATPRGD